MKKTLITLIVIAAIGAIGYAGYEFSSNHSTSTTKPEVASTTGAVQASTATNSDTTANSDKTTKTAQLEKSKETAVTKTSTTNNTNEKASDNKNSDSTIAAYVPTKVIDYAKPSNSSSNTQNKDESSSTSKKVEASASQNVSTNNTNTSSSSNKTTTSNAESTQTTAKPSQPVAQPVAPPIQTAPIISATDVVIPQGSSFNWGLVKASTNQPNTRILFSGAVNTSQPGKYPVLIQAINQQGLKSKKYINVIVEKANVPSLPAPVIAGSNIIIGQGGLYNPGMLDVHATVDGNSVPVTYSGTVDNNKPGIYTVTATATNSQGVSTSKEFTVQVIHVQQ